MTELQATCFEREEEVTCLMHDHEGCNGSVHVDGKSEASSNI